MNSLTITHRSGEWPRLKKERERESPYQWLFCVLDCANDITFYDPRYHGIDKAQFAYRKYQRLTITGLLWPLYDLP